MAGGMLSQGALMKGGRLMAGPLAPGLRESSVPASAEMFAQVVHDGLLHRQGMPASPELTPDEREALRHYIVRTTRAAAAGADMGPYDEEPRH